MNILQKYLDTPFAYPRRLDASIGMKCKKRKVIVDSPPVPTTTKTVVPVVPVKHLSKGDSLPLQSMTIDVTVIDACYKAWVTQNYVNSDEAPIEANYRLLLPKSVSVTKFEVEIDGYVIKGVVKEKEEAQNDYDDAIAEGKSAFKMEQTESKNGNLYDISVGNVPPGSSAIVGFELLSVVKFKEGESLIEIPVEILPTQSIDMNVNFKFETGSPVTVFDHQGLTNADFNANDQTISWSGASSNKSFVLAFATEVSGEPAVLKEDGSDHLMVNYFPDWGAVDEDMIEPQCDIVFVVDRSGSMRGERMTYTKKALEILIHAVPPDSKFNIVSFGGRYTKLFNESSLYDDNTLNSAHNDVAGMDANYGGTDLINPLRDILNENYDKEYPRSIFILTDGAVNDRNGTIDLVKRFSEYCKIFVLGISSGVDKQLVEGLAKAGNGAYEFVLNSRDIEDVTMNLFMQVVEPSYRDLQLGLPNSYSQIPEKLAPLRDGERLLAFGCPSKEGVEVNGISVSATDPYGEQFEIDISNVKTIPGDIIKKFAAISKIAELEAQGNKKKEIIQISVEYQIPSKHTAFVAVDERDSEVVTEHSMVTKNVETFQKSVPAPVVNSSAMQFKSKKRKKAKKDMKPKMRLKKSVKKEKRMISPQKSLSSAPPPSALSSFASSFSSAPAPPPPSASSSFAPSFSSAPAPPPPSFASAVPVSLSSISMAPQMDSLAMSDSECSSSSSASMEEMEQYDSSFEMEKKRMEMEKRSYTRESEQKMEESVKKEKEMEERKKMEMGMAMEERKRVSNKMTKKKKSSPARGKAPSRGKAAPARRMKSRAAPSRSSNTTISSNQSHTAKKGDIISLQKAAGNWEADDVAQSLGWNISDIENSSAYPDDILVWITALALAYMEAKMQDTKNRWKLVARKGIRFIKKAIKDSSVEYDDIVAAANEFVSKNC